MTFLKLIGIIIQLPAFSHLSNNDKNCDMEIADPKKSPALRALQSYL